MVCSLDLTTSACGDDCTPYCLCAAGDKKEDSFMSKPAKEGYCTVMYVLYMFRHAATKSLLMRVGVP